MDRATLKFLTELRDLYVAQLDLLDGKRNPFSGYADEPVLVNTPHARKHASGVVRTINDLIGPEDAQRS